MATWNKQIENRNFLSPIGFRFTLAKYPKVAYFAQSANIPSMTLGIQQQPTPFRALPLEGFITYDPLSISFLVDEDLTNYMIMHNWIRALGTPNDTKERLDFRNKMVALFGNDDLYADATLTVLNSNFKMNFNVQFEGLIPTGLNALEFNATLVCIDYAMAQVPFTYLRMEIQDTVNYSRDKRLT